MSEGSFLRVRAIAKKEVVEFTRDWRTIIAIIVIPLLMFPLLFILFPVLLQSEAAELDALELSIVIQTDGLPENLAENISLSSINYTIELLPNLTSLSEPGKDIERVRNSSTDAVLRFESNDDVVPIDYPVGWSAGNTALYLACQNGAKKVYVLGFDLSSYDQPLNNMYKGTNNYLPLDAKGFNPVNWYNQMKAVFREFSLYDTKFYLVDSTAKFDEDNVSYITKNELCEELKIT